MWFCADAFSTSSCSDSAHISRRWNRCLYETWGYSYVIAGRVRHCVTSGLHSLAPWAQGAENLPCTCLQIRASQDYQRWRGMAVCLKVYSGYCFDGKEKINLEAFCHWSSLLWGSLRNVCDGDYHTYTRGNSQPKCIDMWKRNSFWILH